MPELFVDSNFAAMSNDYVGRMDDQIRSLHAATALSNDNAYLTQQIQATPGIPHELAQQQVRDAVTSTTLFAGQQHEERVNLLKQTHSEELMAVRAEAETARAQQREAVERAAQEGNHLKKELAAKEAQLGELQTANSKIAGDLRVKEEAYLQLESERDGFLAAGECLQARCDELETEADDFAREKQALMDEIEDLKDAAEYLADQGEQSEQQVEELKDNNRVLLEHNSELLCQTVVSDLDLQQTRDTDTKFFDSSAEVLILKMNRPTFGPYYSRCCGMKFLPPHPCSSHHYQKLLLVVEGT